ncbi:heme-binding protein [Patescibacteria group bacterium]|nr:heme-binding protein [Patescibacteria group bacterium]
MYYYILGAIIVGLILWIIGSYAVIWTIEEPTYTILEKKGGYEIRQYEPYIMATTEVTGDYQNATREGFRIIADYIFGNNIKRESIAMTTPVLESPSENNSEKIAMTVPVLESAATNATRTIAFVVPAKYTLDTLPLPNNEAVKLIAVPARKVAVLRYTWYPTTSRTEAKKAELVSYLIRDGKVATGAIETARYNPPLSIPLTLRNEILIPIE